jgi:hypothetical protein
MYTVYTSGCTTYAFIYERGYRRQQCLPELQLRETRPRANSLCYGPRQTRWCLLALSRISLGCDVQQSIARRRLLQLPVIREEAKSFAKGGHCRAGISKSGVHRGQGPEVCGVIFRIETHN